MDESQLLKGILEGCVLAIISRGETYGYEILRTFGLFGFHDLGEGTLYPVLTRLEKKNLIACRRARSALGPVRKYYSITAAGEDYLAAFTDSYQRITKSTEAILNARIPEERT